MVSKKESAKSFPSQDFLTIARVGRPYGVRGWVRIISFSEPPEGIFTYTPWYLKMAGPSAQWQECHVEHHRVSGKHFVAKIAGCEDPDSAKALTHATMAILRSQLASLQEGDYYWHDLEKLDVLTQTGQSLGRVDHLMSTNSNDVLVVKSDGQAVLLIPYIDQAVKKVDVKGGYILVEEDYVVRSGNPKPKKS